MNQFGGFFRRLSKPALVSGMAALLLSACAQQPSQQQVTQAPAPEPAKPAPALIVSNFHPAPPHRGIVAAHIDFTNNTGRTMEYVTFKTTAFDQNGNLVRSRKTGRINAWLRVAGPFASGKSSGDRSWDNVWTARHMACFRIDGAELIDTQGVVEYYTADQMQLPRQVCNSNTALSMND